MAVESVQVQFNPDTSVVDTRGRQEAVLPSYTIAIPLPSESSPVLVTALRADNTAINDEGNYVDPLVQQASEDGYEFHQIVDEGGYARTVMMTAGDWNTYQTSLSAFAQAAAQDPFAYQPSAASQPFGLFRPQVQAGGATPTVQAFHPIEASKMRSSGIGVESFSTSGTPVDIAMYVAGNDAQRSVLLNAGYVEVQANDPDTGGTVSRFVTPLDAQIFRNVPRGTATTRFLLPP